MEELVDVMRDIKYLLTEIKDKLDEIQGISFNNKSLTDIYNKLDEIQGKTILSNVSYSLSDIYDKLEDIENNT